MAVPGIGDGEEMKRWALAVIAQTEAARSDCLNIVLICVCKECDARRLALKCFYIARPAMRLEIRDL